MKPTVSDTVLRDAVAQELERDPEVVAMHISVTAIDGAIALGGHVATIHEKHAAVRAVERVDAVRAVADDIEVRDPSLHERADDEIAQEIAQLQSIGGPIPDSVGAQVRGARVILHGEVESDSQRAAAEDAVGRLTGVRVVDNLINVRARTVSTEGDLEHLVREAIAQTANFHARSIRVQIDNGIAHLSGHVPSFAALQVALEAAEAAPGVTAVESAIVVASEIAHPS